MIPAILLNRGGVNLNRVNPVVKTSSINKDNNKKDSHEQKKNDVKTTAALLRIQK